MSSVDPANADAANAPADPPLPCPKCQRTTDSLKQYSVPTVLFIVIAWAVRRSTEVACPSCMRKTVLRQTLINVPTANILWPFVILPYAGIEFYRSSRKGHSTEIRKRLFPEQFPAPVTAAFDRAASETASRDVARVVGFLKIVAGMIAIGAIGYFLFGFWYDWGAMIWALAVLAAAGVGAACALVISGVGSFRTAPFARKALVHLSLVGAAAFLAASPLVARLYWKYQAAGYAAYDHYAYLHRIPPQLWTAEGVKGLVDWKESVLASSDRGNTTYDGAHDAYGDLRRILNDLMSHHGGEAEFQPLVARIETLLDKYSLATSDEMPASPLGPFDDIPSK